MGCQLRYTMAMTDVRKSFADKCIKDSDGRLLLGQRPNLPLGVGLLALLASWPLEGRAQYIVLMIAFGAWFTWAWLELFQGLNYFRQALGASALLCMLAFVCVR